MEEALHTHCLSVGHKGDPILQWKSLHHSLTGITTLMLRLNQESNFHWGLGNPGWVKKGILRKREWKAHDKDRESKEEWRKQERLRPRG